MNQQRSANEMHLEGYLAWDGKPVKYTQTNKAVYGNGIRIWSGKDRKTGKTVYATMKFESWEEVATRLSQLGRGDKLNVKGYLKDNTYVNNSGTKVYDNKMVVTEIINMEPGSSKYKNDSNQTQQSPQNQNSAPVANAGSQSNTDPAPAASGGTDDMSWDDNEDDVPF